MNKKKFIKAGLIATAAAGFLYAVEKLVFHINTSGNNLEVADAHIYKWQFGDIFYTERGSGSPVLLVHDQAEGASGYEWHKFEEILRESHKVYTIDLPGFGRSDKSKTIYTGYMYVHAIRSFIKDVIGEKAAIITSGSSADAAVLASVGHQDQVGRMIFIEPPSMERTSKLPPRMQRFAMRLIMVPLVGTLVYQIMQSRVMIRKRQAISKNDLPAYSEAAHLGGADGRFAYAGRIGQMTSLNVLHALKDEPHRYLFVGGSEDPSFEKTAEDYRAYLPSAQIRVVSGGGRLPHMDEPAETEAVCSSWLDETV